MTITAYRVVFEPDDNHSWFVRCPTTGAYAQARTLREARANIREEIAAVLDLDPSSFDLVEEVHPRDAKPGTLASQT